MPFDFFDADPDASPSLRLRRRLGWLGSGPEEAEKVKSEEEVRMYLEESRSFRLEVWS